MNAATEMPEKNELFWSVTELIEASKGEIISHGVVAGEDENLFCDISTDTRTISSKDVFLAIKGENFDGHHWVNHAMKSGVKGFIIDKNSAEIIDTVKCKKKGVTVIAVDNTVRALGYLAKYRKNQSGVKVAAITGSNGKTTTRAMTASVLGMKFKTLATKGNFNNEIGLPLTLLRLDKSYEWAVVELGMNAPGEIDYLSAIAEPDTGAIINAGNAHLEGLGTIENVAMAKCEILGRVKKGSTVFINGDDENLAQVVRQRKDLPEIITYGLDAGKRISATDIRQENEGSDFILAIDGQKIQVRLNTPGLFMVRNALAAAGIGYKAGVPIKDIAAGLAKFKPVPGRLTIKKGKNELTVIDDTYNANPDSLKEALKLLKQMKNENRGIAVIGDMLELGVQSRSHHYLMGLFCAENGIDIVCATGDYAESVAEGALKGGLKQQNIFAGSQNQVITFLRNTIASKDWVLVKGSRGMKMERVVESLLGNKEGTGE